MTYQDFLSGLSVQIPIVEFLVNLSIVLILSFLLSLVYVKFGRSLSNRKAFASNLILVSLITMLIISIVKSSLALSLGLVGALSIVRFRAAIKEPEELSYLFLAIAVGLGLGANQRLITIIAFVFIAGVIVVWSLLKYGRENANLFLSVKDVGINKVELKQIIETLKKSCSELNLKRFDETSEVIEATFLVGFKNFNLLNQCRHDLKKINDSLEIVFLDDKNIVS